MGRRGDSGPARWAAVAVGLLVLVAGLGYALNRPARYESTGTMVLNPAPSRQGDLPTVLDSFTSSGTLGTAVELLGSPDLDREAGGPGVTYTVRAVPDTRVVQLSATGRDRDVQAALERLMTLGKRRHDRLVDQWNLVTLSAPGAPAAAGPSPRVLAVAAVLLAALASAGTLIALRRMHPARRAVPFADLDELDEPMDSRRAMAWAAADHDAGHQRSATSDPAAR